ncbi:MAG: DNA-binding transcriptional regulator [Tannerella sp.]|jgi:LacI family transcriptional regulator|nr:DNA-binding transcriptional regulator [Tannerella sp.]
MKTILLFTDFSSGYSQNLLKGFVQYSTEFELSWVFYRMPLAYRELHGDDGVALWAKQWKADAVIALLDDVNLDVLNQLEIPIVTLNRKHAINGCNIDGDYFGTGVMAAEFFVKRGFSHFAWYGLKHAIWSRKRAVGFIRSLRKQGFTVSALNNAPLKNEYWSFDTAILGKWLLSLPKPVALFACDDYFASQIIETCRMYNIAVPDDIAVLGVDNDELICKISSPLLSSIVLDVQNGGYQAAGILRQLMDGEILQDSDIVIRPLWIETRKSTEKYVVDDKHIMKVIKYITENYSAPISVADIMKMVPLSRRILEQRFKNLMGTTIYQYLLRYRIEQFASLLIKTDKPIYELAKTCGLYGDYKNLRQTFRKFMKTTPQQYRKMTV